MSVLGAVVALSSFGSILMVHITIFILFFSYIYGFGMSESVVLAMCNFVAVVSVLQYELSTWGVNR